MKKKNICLFRKDYTGSCVLPSDNCNCLKGEPLKKRNDFASGKEAKSAYVRNDAKLS